MRIPALTARGRRGRGSLARQLLGLQALVLLVVVVALGWLAVARAQAAVEDRAANQSRSIAETIADSPLVRSAVVGTDPTAVLQPYVEQVRADTATSFITVMAPDRTRFTHPDPDQIGQPFVGNIAEALAGEAFTETYTGTLGPSVRTVAPIFATGSSTDVVALVSVGITVAAIGDDVAAALPGVLGVAAAVLAAGALGSWLISRRLRRQTHGLGAAPLARMLEYYDAVLHAVREGLLLLDGDRRVQLVNDEARRLLELDGDVTGRHVTELGLSPELATTLSQQRLAVDEVHVSGSRVLVVSQAPATPKGGSVGAVVTLRDHTDLQALTGELDSVRAFAESLRSQAHEAANRLHTTVSLVELGRTEEAVEFATSELAVAQRLTDRVVEAVEEPVLAALLLGKAATAHERGVALEIDPATAVGTTGIPGGDLVTIVGNLLDNAIDAALAGDAPREVQLSLWQAEGRLELRVEDTGPGVADPEQVFARGWTTKSTGQGLGLALVAQAVKRNGGTVSVRPGPGAEFSVSLPVRAAVAP
ncbi:Sensor histidine kinase regulating citrate/malate metabolism [Klenkia soli]|uniref:histidine kinase n=1 Tax=Klenkia soli TaxID=1052260 RepID=A0A1H0UHV0_9ACTN|nr:sensor histidine kinase [Klenkia soli]SDP65568.1 Sensor histidine kinase regulating citrate/malate metabolism [Klenkia soli]